MIHVGVIGFSEGNGHPFSFSAIINGFDDAKMAESGWPVIHNYLRARDPAELGGLDAAVTMAWTPDPRITGRLCAAARIPRACEDVAEMHGEVDAVLILRDDASSHRPLAMPFLERGVPVFVDKPLTLSLEELFAFERHLREAKLMSCAGLRFARELDETRADVDRYGALRLVRAAVVLDWERYGIHMLEAIMSVVRALPIDVTCIAQAGGAESFRVRFENDVVAHVDCLGEAAKTFRIDFHGAKATTGHDLLDNFTAFRRTITNFLAMVRDGVPPIAADETIAVVRAVLAGRASRVTGKAVALAALEETTR